MPARLAAVLAAATILAAPAHAAGPLQVTTRLLVATRVAAADGTTRVVLAAPAKIVPGDRVTVVLGYRNTGNQPIADLVLANPVPRGMRYRAAVAGSPQPEVSIDGRRFGPLAALSTATAAGGTRPATAADVTAVRWRLPAPVAAGAGGELAFEAVLQ